MTEGTARAGIAFLSVTIALYRGPIEIWCGAKQECVFVCHGPNISLGASAGIVRMRKDLFDQYFQ